MITKVDWVDLGLACAEVCCALVQGMSGRQEGELSQLVVNAVEELAV